MKPAQSDSKSIQTYHWGFVVGLTAVFLFFLLMTSKQQGIRKFEANFFQRELFIETFNHLRIKIGDHVFNNVLIGRDGWMEFTGNQNIDDYQNVIHFSNKQLARMGATIQSCYQFAKERNMTFLIVVAPNKASIYPDKLPEQIQPLSDVSRLDQLNHYLKEHGIREVLDLRPALRQARQEHDVFYKMGTHWNRYGAYTAYKVIINTLSQSYPDLAPYSANFFRFRSFSASPLGDKRIAELIEANYFAVEPTLFPTRKLDAFYHKVNFPIPREMEMFHKMSWIPNSDLPSLLIYHDSFGRAGLNDFLGLNFSKVFYIHRNVSSKFLNQEMIEQFAPDIVIYEVVERNLQVIPNQLLGCNEN